MSFSRLSYIQVDKHGITIYTTYISVILALAHHEVYPAKGWYKVTYVLKTEMKQTILKALLTHQHETILTLF